MATLRMFANLRESAGTTSADFSGATVGDVVSGAVAAYGDEFARGLETAKIWVNGDPAGLDSPVGEGDEIALIPPVSGGAVATSGQPDLGRAALVVALVLAVAFGNLLSEEVFAFVAVGAAMAWLWDVAESLTLRASKIQVIPAMAAAAAAANGAYGWGREGLAAGVVVGVGIVLVWSVLDRRSRSIEAIGNASLLAIVSALGIGGLVLVNLRNEDEVTLFLGLATVTVAAAWAAGKYAPPTSGLDPNVAGLLTALVAGVVAAFTTEIVSTPVMILAAVAIGAGFIAGRTLGSLTRTGTVMHTARAPGLLTMFDGPIVAAGLFWLVMAVFA